MVCIKFTASDFVIQQQTLAETEVKTLFVLHKCNKIITI